MINRVVITGVLEDDNLVVEKKDNITRVEGFVLTQNYEGFKAKRVKITLYNDLGIKYFNRQNDYRENICLYKCEISFSEVLKTNILKVIELPTELIKIK